jgi:hypothetical protein
MTTDMNLQQIKQKAYTRFHQDGLLDILAGLMLFGYGLGMVTGITTFTAISWLPIMLYQPLKNAITVPRIGMVKFQDKETQKRKLSFSLLLGVFLLLGLMIFYLFGRDNLPQSLDAFLRTNIFLIFGIMMAMMFVGLGYFMTLSRMNLYAGWIILAFAVGQFFLMPNEEIVVLIAGGVIFLVGLFYLIRFLGQNPKVDPDVSQ